MGFEPTTSTLGRWHSTVELQPHIAFYGWDSMLCASGCQQEKRPRTRWFFPGILALGGIRIPYYNAVGGSIRIENPLCGADGQMTCPQSKFGRSDTTPEARRVQYDIYRRMSLGRKLELVFDMYDTGQRLAMAGLRMRYPGATEEELKRLWAKQHLGRRLFARVYGGPEHA